MMKTVGRIIILVQRKRDHRAEKAAAFRWEVADVTAARKVLTKLKQMDTAGLLELVEDEDEIPPNSGQEDK